MIGFTSTSLRSCSIEKVVETAVRAKAEIIEWGSDVHIRTAEDAGKAKALCAENGIIINSYGTYYRIGSSDEAEFKKICETARIMGAEFIRTWLGERGSAQTVEAEYKKILEDAGKTADIAAAYGLTVCNECHPNTYNDTAKSALKFLNDVNRPNVRTYYQSWYCDYEGDMEKLEATFDFVQDVHISFSELEKFQKNGIKDEKFIEKILDRLALLGFKNGILIEFTKDSDPENLIKDIARLRDLVKAG